MVKNRQNLSMLSKVIEIPSKRQTYNKVPENITLTIVMNINIV